ncbi:MAG: LptF/LptG family permease [Microcystis sp. LE19-84.1B]|uniref:YjgP/YjgQ family permease n=1 Tax=Microcystis flos-aquae TF09 TaxID=2060473 RepID=A0A3E0KVU2_9CHRO|nr:LptF/LptG family permease [Microcystis sp. LE19-84.1B]MCZ8224124.1 LptF/LptG family permease [Microcystis sp. LE19-84.1B]REJ39380.1 MAG: YjgP/YjgQ family permease [Microcystis flos-aquae TF09]
MIKKKISYWVNGGIALIDRYLISQLLPPFLFSVGLFASLGVAIGNLSDLANQVVDANLPLVSALEILLLKVPEFVTYSLPVSLLLATLITYGRLSSDSETVALQSCGVTLYRLFIPTFCLSLIVTVVTFLLNEYVVPNANYRATEILVQKINKEANFWKNKDFYYPDYEIKTLENGTINRNLRSLFYAEQFDGEKMKTVTVIRWLKQELNQIIIADSARWNAVDNVWDFFNGIIYELTPPNASYSQVIPFKTEKIALSRSAFDFARQSRDPYEMNIPQAIEYVQLLKLSGDDKRVRFFQVRIQQKIAFPFVCIVFATIGCALGSLPQRISRGTSFGLSVAIVFLYYLLNFLVGSLGLTATLSPFLAAWLPNFFGFGLGLWLLWRLNG